MQTKGSLKSLPCRGLLLSVYELMPQAANLMFCLISPVAQSPAWSVEGQVRTFYFSFIVTKLSSDGWAKIRRNKYILALIVMLIIAFILYIVKVVVKGNILLYVS